MIRILGLSALLFALLAAFGCKAEEKSDDADFDTSNLETVVVNVEGMT